MRNALRTASIPPLLLLFVCIYIARGADDPGPVSCPESCAGSRKNCELSCSQIVGGGVESGKKRECFGACADEEVSCNERCLNPTPRPTLKPGAYSDESCSGACGFMSRDCKEACTKHVGGGAAGVERAKCENACDNELDKCTSRCSSPTPAPVIDPGVYENNPCSGECSSELEKCEGTCAMFSGEGENGGKRGECMTGCKGAEYNCLEACPR
jgi:hypothetical protein